MLLFISTRVCCFSFGSAKAALRPVGSLVAPIGWYTYCALCSLAVELVVRDAKSPGVGCAEFPLSVGILVGLVKSLDWRPFCEEFPFFGDDSLNVFKITKGPVIDCACAVAFLFSPLLSLLWQPFCPDGWPGM